MKTLYSLLSIVIVFTLTQCGNSEKANQTIDSLRKELAVREQYSKMTSELNSILDSLNAERARLKSGLNTGLTKDQVLASMQNIKTFIEQSQAKIAQLENVTDKAVSISENFLGIVKKLKTEVTTRDEEMKKLSALLDKAKADQKTLITAFDFQEDELFSVNEKLKAKINELKELEQKLKAMQNQMPRMDANAVYERAQEVEETARRTKLAPTKKRETLQKALDLYKSAYSLGKKEAKEKVEEIEKRLK